MEINIKGRHMAVAPEIQAYANDKIGRVGKLVDSPVTEVEIELFVEKNPSIQNSQVAEVTVFTKGPVIRAREASTDMHAAIDLVSDKLERQIKRYRGKVIDKHTRGPRGFETKQPFGEEAEQPGPDVVKTKVLSVKPMTTEEAILQMELLGHDFFVFMEPENDDINVLYRRRDGDYGVIAPRNR
jgi:putative sigma-54 modulation protein